MFKKIRIKTKKNNIIFKIMKFCLNRKNLKRHYDFEITSRMKYSCINVSSVSSG